MAGQNETRGSSQLTSALPVAAFREHAAHGSYLASLQVLSVTFFWLFCSLTTRLLLPPPQRVRRAAVTAPPRPANRVAPTELAETPCVGDVIHVRCFGSSGVTWAAACALASAKYLGTTFWV